MASDKNITNGNRSQKKSFFLILLIFFSLIISCSNNPYRTEDSKLPIYYSSLPEDPKTLDPAKAYDSVSWVIIGPIYESLLQYAYLKRPYQIEPALAEKIPLRETYSYKGKEADQYTFYIKKGLRYQDDACFPQGKGREVISDDFIYALKRIADPMVFSPAYSILGPKIAGMEDFFNFNNALADRQQKEKIPAQSDYSMDISGLKKIDDYTFTVSLTEKYPQFLYWMTMPFTAPMPKEAVEYYNSNGKFLLGEHPVGTGAYYLKDFKKGEYLLLAKNPNFRQEYYPNQGDPEDIKAGLLNYAGQPLPFIEKIRFTIIKESIPRWNLFMQGYLDASGVSSENFEKVITKEGTLSEEMIRKEIKLERSKKLSTYYYAFNMDDPLLGKNKKLRQAISLAINTADYLDIFNNKLGEIAQSPLPPGMFGYRKDYRNPYRKFDLEQAKKLLTEAGYPGGLNKSGQRLEITYDTSATSASGKQTTGFLIKQLEAIGIHLNVITNDWNTQQQKADSGNFQFMTYGWHADYPDPENFFFLLHSANKRPGVNLANYSNPEFDRLFNEMKNMENTGEEGAKRAIIIEAMIKILEEDTPWVFNFHDEGYSLFYGWLKNIKLHDPGQNLLKYYAIDAEKRDSSRRQWNRPNYLFLYFLIGGGVILTLFLGRKRFGR